MLDYVTACSNCLEAAKDKRKPLCCDSFCKDCFVNKAVCAERKDLFTEWQCDIRPCVRCVRLLQQGNQSTHCLRFRVLVSISDQDSTHEKYGKSVSYSLQEFLNGQSPLSFPYFHFHDIGYHLKNAQASLERGTLFDGKYSFDATDILLSLITSKDDVFEKISSGLAHAALGQFDKHSDEHALQRISKNVTKGLTDIGSIVKTDIPEVLRPWFAQNHSKIGSILFVTLSASGIVFCTDDYNQQLFYYRQTPIPRRVVFLTSGKTEEVEDITPNAPKTVSSKKVKWSSISGLTIVPCDEDVNRTHRRKEALLVADQDLHCLGVFKGINTL